MKKIIWVLFGNIFIVLSCGCAANQPALRIMPLGDSISMGSNYPGAYRVELERLLKQNSVHSVFVGSQSNGPAELENQNHEGHSGWTIAQISAKTFEWISISQPDVVLLMIGTNDVGTLDPVYVPDVPAALTRLKDLVQLIFNSKSKIRLVISTIPPTPQFWNQYVIQYNTGIREIVVAELNAGKNIRLADSYSSLSLTDLDLNDGVGGAHPLPIGYDKIATTWFASFR